MIFFPIHYLFIFFLITVESFFLRDFTKVKIQISVLGSIVRLFFFCLFFLNKCGLLWNESAQLNYNTWTGSYFTGLTGNVCSKLKYLQVVFYCEVCAVKINWTELFFNWTEWKWIKPNEVKLRWQCHLNQLLWTKLDCIAVGFWLNFVTDITTSENLM